MFDDRVWILPSYGRPHKLEAMKSCPGGLPPSDSLLVVLNEDDPALAHYFAIAGFQFYRMDAGSRCGDVWRACLRDFSGSKRWGLFADDMWPQTPEWWLRLEEAASDTCIAYTNGDHTDFPLMRGGAVCLGGRLVQECREHLVPSQFRHNYIDVVINDLGNETGIMRPLEDVRVDHHHWKFHPGAVRDATYMRGSMDQNEDASRYQQWCLSQERHRAVDAIRKMLVSA